MENLYASPRLSGTMLESPDYQILGTGLTDRVFLIGHNDYLDINSPYQVIDMREAVNKLGADSTSPLFRAMFQAYNAGCRDIWLVAGAPMSEWVPVNNTYPAYNDVDPYLHFYSTWSDRLIETYQVLESFDQPQFIVPLHAPIDSELSDFLTPLAEHCNNAFNITGSMRIGVIGSQFNITESSLYNLARSSRMTLGDGGKFVISVLGEAVFNPTTSLAAFRDPLPATVAGLASTLPLDRGLTYARLPGVVSITGSQLNPDQIDFGTTSRLNFAIRTQRGKRGQAFEIVMSSDSTLGTNGTDYWAMIQIRLVSRCIEQLRMLGRRYLGTIGFGEFKRDCQNYLLGLSRANVIRDYNLNIVRDPVDRNKVLVDVTLAPYFSVRQINFMTRVGPGV